MPLFRRSVERHSTLLAKLDGALFGFAGLAAVWLAFLLVEQGVRPGWPLLLLVVFWVVFTYLLLPRVHRILTRLYTPDYFIGRTRTGDGLLGDPVNLALLAQEHQIHQAMSAAGWVRADDLAAASTRRMITSTLFRRRYPTAPVSALMLFDRQQDFAYQQEVGRSTSKRHHVRFWRCPEGWLLPGGHEADWLAAGTYDRSVGFSLFTLQITHKIEQDTDIERDFIVSSLTTADERLTVETIENFSTGYHSRNGGGDLIETDGDLPVLDLTAVGTTSDPQVVPTDSRDKRPWQTVFGGGVGLVRAAVDLVLALALVLLPDLLLRLDPELSTSFGPGERSQVFLASGIVLVLLAVVDARLSQAVLAGRNWARLTAMLVSVGVTLGSFVGNVTGLDVATVADLPAVGGSVLVLLALSSHRAREYAARGRRMPKQVDPETARQAAGVPLP